MAKYDKAGADAAGQYDEAFKRIIANDPDVQRVIQSVWGTGARPSDTPKHLEKANAAASKQIGQILQSKGITLPERTFINPRSGALEGHRGWSGLSGIQKAAIIAAAGATGIGAAAAMGALGGSAAAAGGLATPGVTTGLPAGMSGVGATGFGFGGVPLGGSLTSSMLTNAGINAAKTKLTGGSWKDALLSGGVGAATGGAGGNMGWTDTLIKTGKDFAKDAGKGLIQQLMTGRGLSATGQGLGAIGSTQAHNRGVALEAMMAGDEMALAADRERRAAEADIMKKMQITEYLKGGGFKDPGVTMSASGKPFTQFDFGTRGATEGEMGMASELQGQLQNRLSNPLKLSDYASKMEPGKMESTLNWLGPILSSIGQSREPDYWGELLRTVRGQATQTPQAPPVPGTTTPPAAPTVAQDFSNVQFEPLIPKAGKPSYRF